MSRDELMTTDEVAAQLRKSPITVKQWRWLGQGPTYVRVGRHIRYRSSDVAAWLDAQAVHPGAA